MKTKFPKYLKFCHILINTPKSTKKFNKNDFINLIKNYCFGINEIEIKILFDLINGGKKLCKNAFFFLINWNFSRIFSKNFSEFEILEIL